MAHDTQVTTLRATKDGHRMRVLYSESRGTVQKESMTDRGRVDFRDSRRGDLHTYRAAIKSAQRGGYRIESTDQTDMVRTAPADTVVVAEDGKGGWAWICSVKGCPHPYGTASTQTNARMLAQLHLGKH